MAHLNYINDYFGIYLCSNDIEIHKVYNVNMYSENYKNAIMEGKTFIIKDKNSVVYKHMCVAKRVPIQGTGRIALVEKHVQNLKPYFDE